MENSIHQDKDTSDDTENNVCFFGVQNVVDLIVAGSDFDLVVGAAGYGFRERVEGMVIGSDTLLLGDSFTSNKPILGVVSNSDMVNIDSLFESTLIVEISKL